MNALTRTRYAALIPRTSARVGALADLSLGQEDLPLLLIPVGALTGYMLASGAAKMGGLLLGGVVGGALGFAFVAIKKAAGA